MNRAEFLAVVKDVLPAVASGDAETPSFACVGFRGGVVQGFDGVLAIVREVNHGLSGGVQGHVLAAWLAAATNPLLTTTVVDDALTIKCGRAKCSLAMVPEEDLLFDPARVDMGDAEVLPLSSDVLDAMSRAAVGMGTDPRYAWRIGLTMDLANGVVYSCDNITVTRVDLSAFGFEPSADAPDVILHPRLWQLASSWKKDGVELYVRSGGAEEGDWMGVQLSPDLVAFTGMIEPAVATYESVFEQADDSLSEYKIGIPAPLDSMLQRAEILAKGQETSIARLIVRDGKLRIVTEGPLGRGSDVVKITGHHDDVEVLVRPEMLRRCLSHAVFMRITEDKVYLCDANMVQIVSALSS